MDKNPLFQNGSKVIFTSVKWIHQNLKKSLFLVGSLLSVILYQNCAPVEFNGSVDMARVMSANFIMINNGDPYTRDVNVQVQVVHEDNFDEVYITNDSTCMTGGAWQPVQSVFPWTLANKNSVAHVYAQFRDTKTKDKSGNPVPGSVTGCGPASITHDDIPPVVNVDALPAFTNLTNLVINSTAQDNLSGVGKYECMRVNIDSKFSECTEKYTLKDLKEGEKRVQVQAHDKAGNVSNPQEVTFFVDLTPPELSFQKTPPSEVFTGAIEFLVTAKDLPAGSGIDKYVCTLDGVERSSCSQQTNLTSLNLGSHTFEIYVQDYAGNKSPTLTHQFQVNSLGDLAVLGVTGGSDTTVDNRLAGSRVPTVSFQRSQGAVSHELSILNGSAVKCALVTLDASVDKHAFSGCSLPDGEYSVKLTAISPDNVKKDAATFTFRVDATAPVILATATYLNIDNSSVKFEFTVTDDNSIESTTCYLDKAQKVCTGSTRVEYTQITPGNHYFEIKAKDSFGNTGTSNRIEFTTETALTDFQIQGVAGGSKDSTKDDKLIGTGKPTLYWTTASAKFYKVKISEGTTAVCSEASTQNLSYSFSCDLSEGVVYTAQVTPYNNADKAGTAKTLDFKVHKYGPKINLTSIQGKANSVTLNFTATDNDTYVDVVACSIVGVSNEVNCKSGTYTADGLTSGMPYTAKIRAVDDFGNETVFEKEFNTSFLNSSPSLAIRGSSCIACHANIKSDFVTDAGYGSPWFFGKGGTVNYGNRAVDLGYYGDHELKSLITMKVTGGSIFVPYAPLGISSVTSSQFFNPNGVSPADATNQANLKRVVESGITLKKYLEYNKAAETTATVKEKTVYIGSLSANEILSASGINSSNLGEVVYKPRTGSSITSYSGIGAISSGNFRKVVSTTLACDGDLFIHGNLFMKDVTVRTDQGCRIYVTGVVFVDGTIKYEDINKAQGVDLSNLQIASAVSINLGVGQSHCETSSLPYSNWYYENCVRTNNVSGDSCNPLLHRYQTYKAPTRNDSAGTAVLDAVKTAANALGSDLLDATCRGGSDPRAVSFERLLLNAPTIHSRYIGDFKGVVVGEVVLFSVGKFSFTFDSVFQRVPLLPAVNFTEKVLNVQ